MTKPDNMPWLSPFITVKDVKKACEFYKAAFHFSEHYLMEDDAGPAFAELTYKDQMIMVGREGAFDNPAESVASSGKPSPVSLYIYCEDVDAFYQHALEQGATGIVEPFDTDWGDRMCRVEDPDQLRWAFATKVRPCDGKKD